MAGERQKAIGISYLGYGTPGDGVVSASLTEVEAISKDTVAFNFADLTETPIDIEQSDDPLFTILTKGSPDSFEFAIPSPKSSEFGAFMGGTVTGDKYEDDGSVKQQSLSIVIKTKPIDGKYIQYTFPKCTVSAKISEAPGKEKTELLLVKCVRDACITTAGVRKPSFIREEIGRAHV